MDTPALTELNNWPLIAKSIADLTQTASYLTPTELACLTETCHFGAEAHRHQKRRSGEPYICHPIRVAEILADEVQFNLPVLQAAILHDVIEDTAFNKAALTAKFGNEVADLVDGVSKLEKQPDVSPALLQAKTFSKFIQAIEKDPRVVMIKFADRMHNMQTLDSLPSSKRRRIAAETLEVYVPIATRLGMFSFKTNLEELAFRQVYPWRYQIIEKLIKENPERLELANQIIDQLSHEFKRLGLHISLRHRRRNLRNIYEKIKKHAQNHRPLANASIPLVVITQNVDESYRALGIIHSLYRPIFKKLTDYIASPKVNGYQSIHTSVIAQNRYVINFQIRTQTMHTIAEAGLIAIWRQHNQASFQQDKALRHAPKDKPILNWLGNIRNLQSLINDPLDYYQSVKKDLSSVDIQVFTPKGEAIALPAGSTIIDFAYHIHTNVGHKMVAAKVNDVNVPLTFVLEGGQTVEILTESLAHPRVSWLKNIQTARARAAIRHYFHHIPSADLSQIGQAALKQFLRQQGYAFETIQPHLAAYASARGLSVEEWYQKVALDEEKKSDFLSALLQQGIGKEMLIKLTIVANNRPGILAKISEKIAQHQANIEHFYAPEQDDGDQKTMHFLLSVMTREARNNLLQTLRQLPMIKSVNDEVKNETNH